MTMDGGRVPAPARHGPGPRKPQVVEALADFARGTRRYLAVSTVFGLIVAVLDTIALALLGVPLPLLWGLLAFITNYIPNIGFVIGLIPPAILALLEGGPGLMLAVIAVYCVLNVVIQSVIQPKVVGDTVGPVDHAELLLAGVLDLGDRPARRAAGDPAHAVRQGAAGRRRPATRAGCGR